MRQRREASACVVCCLCIAYAFSRCCNFLTCSGDSLLSLSLSPFRCVSHSAGGIAFGTKSAACKSRVSVCLCVDVCRCVDVQYLPPAHKIVLSLYLRGLQKERKRERGRERGGTIVSFAGNFLPISRVIRANHLSFSAYNVCMKLHFVCASVAGVFSLHPHHLVSHYAHHCRHFAAHSALKGSIVSAFAVRVSSSNYPVT